MSYVVSLEGRTPLLAPLTEATVSEEKEIINNSDCLARMSGYLETSPRGDQEG